MRNATYKVVRHWFKDYRTAVIERRLTLEEAQAHCRDPETSSRTCKPGTMKIVSPNGDKWFDGYEQE